jgi:hypothetical protein
VGNSRIVFGDRCSENCAAFIEVVFSVETEMTAHSHAEVYM